MRAARKILCLVVSIPTASGGSISLSLVRYTNEAMSVEVGTFECRTRVSINFESAGISPQAGLSEGDEGGVGYVSDDT